MKLTKEQQAMVEANMPLVGFTINKYLGSANLDYEDMTSIGYIGLCKAVVKYKPESGFKFSTYASIIIVHCIQKEMMLSRRKKRGADFVMVSYDMILDDVANGRRKASILGYEPDFSDMVIEHILYEPVWKLCPTYRRLCSSPLTPWQIGKLEGVTAAALFARKKKEFKKARWYLKRIGIQSAVRECV